MFNNLKNYARKNLRNTNIFHVIWFSRQFFAACGNRNSLVYNCRSYTSNNYIRSFFSLLTFPIGFFNYFIPTKNIKREGLAIVLIAKNEGDYIEEWLNFHKKQGVSHFIIYDNNSTDNLEEILKPYIESGIATYQKLGGQVRQIDAYNMAVDKYKNKFKYMAFIDADEFLFCIDNCVKYLRGGTI